MPIQQWSPIINRYCAGELYYTNAQSLSLPHSLLVDKNASRCVTVLFLTFNVNKTIPWNTDAVAIYFRLKCKQSSILQIET